MTILWLLVGFLVGVFVPANVKTFISNLFSSLVTWVKSLFVKKS